MGISIKPPCDEAQVEGAPGISGCDPSTGKWILAASILGSSLAFIDGSAVNVALPVMQNAFDATLAQVQWFVEAYALCLGALMLVGGSLGDNRGHRNVFLRGVVIFSLASALCAVARSPMTLILARGLQGVGGALMVPGSLALISANFSPEQRGKAIGTWAAFTAITAAIGPVLGGWLTETWTWRLIFLINLPAAAVILGIGLWRVPPDRQPTGRRVDWMGGLLATVALGGITFGLIESQGTTFAEAIPWLVGGVGVLASGAFVVWELAVPDPMLPVGLFRSTTFSGTNIMTLLLYAALGGALFFVPFNLIQVQQYSPTAAGAALLPLVLIIFLLSRWSGTVSSHVGFRIPLIVGPLTAAAGFALFAVPGLTGSYWTTFFPAVVTVGLGMAVTVAPLSTAVMNSVRSERAGIASGVNNTASRVASLLAVALMGVLLMSRFQGNLSASLDRVEISSGAREVILAQSEHLNSIELPGELSQAQAAELDSSIRFSFLGAFRLVMFTAAGLALASALTAFLTIQGGRGTGERQPA